MTDPKPRARSAKRTTTKKKESPTTKPKMGRPTTYTPEMARLICEQVAKAHSLRTIAKMIPDCPDPGTICLWLTKHEDFSEQYTKARVAAADTMAEQIMDIGDDGTNDWMQKNDPDNPGYKQNGEHIQRSKLRVDTRKWLMARLQPRKYGERFSQEISGPGGGPIETSVTTTINVSLLSDNTLRELLAAKKAIDENN